MKLSTPLVKKFLVWAVVVVAVGMSGTSMWFLRLSVLRYRNEQLVRLDPTQETRMMEFKSRLKPPAANQKRVVYFGDSRIERWKPLPEMKGVQPVNVGIAGDTTAQMKLRFERDVLALNPDVVVLEAGINDIKAIGVVPQWTSKIIDGTRSRLRYFVTELKKRDIQVVVTTVFPPAAVSIFRTLIWSDKIRPAVETVNAAIRSWDGPGVYVVDADLVLLEDGQMRGAYADDTLHLNDNGYEALRPAVETAVRRALNR